VWKEEICLCDLIDRLVGLLVGWLIGIKNEIFEFGLGLDRGCEM